MNGIDYLVDTNCFIYFLDGHPILKPFANDIWGFSFITEMELLSKNDLSIENENAVRQMLGACVRLGHSHAITESTILLRKKYRIKLPDAIIAATCHVLTVPLLTADRQFEKLEEIDCMLLDV